MTKASINLTKSFLFIGILCFAQCNLEKIEKSQSLVPVACFASTPPSCEVGCSIDFNADCSKNAILFKWDFDNDLVFEVESSNKEVTSPEFKEAGTHRINLEVENDMGDKDVVSMNVIIIEPSIDPPDAIFTISPDICDAPCQVEITNTSQGIIDAYSWNFGDGTEISIDKDPLEHIYDSVGLFSLQLIVSGPGGIDSFARDVEVRVSPVMSNFTYQKDLECPALPCIVSFENNSENASSYLWDFGDGLSSTENSPDHSYNAHGEYMVKLKVIGMQSEHTDSILVEILPATFLKTQGGNDSENGWDVILNNQNNFTIVGRTESFGNLNKVYYLEFDQNGDNINELAIDESSNAEGRSIYQTEDGGYIIAGNQANTNSFSDNMYLLKLFSNGSKEWSTIYSHFETKRSIGFDAVQMDDDDYVMSAGAPINIFNRWFSVFKFENNSGEYADEFFYEGNASTDWGSANALIKNNQGWIVATGQTNSTNIFCNIGFGETDMILHSRKPNLSDISGDFCNKFGGAENDVGSDLKQLDDGGYIIVGSTRSFGKENQVFLVRTDANGQEIWSHNYGGNDDDAGYSLDLTHDGGFIICGSTSSFGNGSQIYLLKISDQGELLWERNFGESGFDSGWAVLTNSDGGFFVTGNTQSFGAKGYDVLILKTDSEGKVAP